MRTRFGARLYALIVVALALAGGLVGLGSAPAHAGPCSAGSGASTCAVSTQTTIGAGLLTVSSSPNLYWSFVGDAYDQISSASSTAYSGCVASGVTPTNTYCLGGTMPTLLVDDATGANGGWSLSAYLTNNNLPAGSRLTFNGFGTAVNTALFNANSTGAYSGSPPGTVCDYGSSCTVPTVASTCAHSTLGFTSCPTYSANLAAGTSATSQVDLYSAAVGTGQGAICFGTGTATASGCIGSTSNAFWNLGIRGDTPAGTYSNTVINIGVNSGP